MNNIDFNSLEFNLYELLNIPINSTLEEIKKSFKRLVKKFHPDKITKIEEKLYYDITYANMILSNDILRSKYDDWLLNSHKSHISLKTAFKEELKQLNSPLTKEEAVLDFQKKFEELGKRHGDYMDDNKKISDKYKDKEKERGHVNIVKEDYSSMDEFNNRFSEKKKKGIYSTSIVRRETAIQPYTFGNTNYTELTNRDNIYLKDSQIEYAFELIPTTDDNKYTKVDNISVSTKYNPDIKHNRMNFNNLDI